MHKNGFTLPFILMLSVVLIGSATALVAHIMHSLDTVKALYNGEKAYMKAESGIDMALLEVRKNTLQELSDYNYNDTTVSINTYNSDDNDDIYTLEAGSCYRLPYRKDMDTGLIIAPQALSDGSIGFTNHMVEARISVICDGYDEESSTIHIESNEVIHMNNQPLQINTLINNIINTDNCTLIIKNEGDDTMNFTLHNLITPAIKITSEANMDSAYRRITTTFPRATEKNCNLNISENSINEA